MTCKCRRRIWLLLFFQAKVASRRLRERYCRFYFNRWWTRNQRLDSGLDFTATESCSCCRAPPVRFPNQLLLRVARGLENPGAFSGATDLQTDLAPPIDRDLTAVERARAFCCACARWTKKFQLMLPSSRVSLKLWFLSNDDLKKFILGLRKQA